MNKYQIENLEGILDESYELALQQEVRMGRKNTEKFAENNPDYIYYKGLIDALLALGLDFQRSDKGNHKIFK